MKLIALAAAAILAGFGLARAETRGGDWSSRERVAKTLQDKRYTDIREIEADDGQWNGDAAIGGRAVEVHFESCGNAFAKSGSEH